MKLQDIKMKASAFVNQLSSLSSAEQPKFTHHEEVTYWGDDDRCIASTKGSDPLTLVTHPCTFKRTLSAWK